jgi:putative flippase GtrA
VSETDATGLRPRLAAFARTHDEKLRFLVTGGFNTLVGYGLFALALLLLGVDRYNIALAASWTVSVLVSYSTFKAFVFRTRGTNRLHELGRSYLVYAGTLLANLAVLNLMVKVAGLHPLVGQLASIAVVTVLSYLGHKYFTFSGAARADEGPGADKP